jgi:hypothetical protein
MVEAEKSDGDRRAACKVNSRMRSVSVIAAALAPEIVVDY